MELWVVLVIAPFIVGFVCQGEGAGGGVGMRKSRVVALDGTKCKSSARGWKTCAATDTPLSFGNH